MFTRLQIGSITCLVLYFGSKTRKILTLTLGAPGHFLSMPTKIGEAVGGGIEPATMRF